jgi:lipoprotein-anchoring transpeptidase ErfK/SrfK
LPKSIMPHQQLAVLLGLARSLALTLGGALLVVVPAAPANASMFLDQGFGSSVWREPRYEQPVPVRRHSMPRRPRGTESGEPDQRHAIKGAQGVRQAVISIRDQTLTLYADGAPVTQSRVATGVPEHPTPTGIFSIIDKDRYHTSNIYSGAPMPFMQRLTRSGVALHLGEVPNHPASHGCIRLPDAFARQLWVTTELADRVVIARDEIAPVAFAHERLFALRRPAPPTPTTPAAPDQPVSEGMPSSVRADGPTGSTPVAADGTRGKSDPVQLAAAEGTAKTILPAALRGSIPDPMPTKSVEPPLKPGPISVFISRQEGRLFVRKGFQPVLEVPVKIERPEQPLGTHLYTALGFTDDGIHLRWNVLTMPATAAAATERPVNRASRRRAEREEVPMLSVGPASSAVEALERITIPEGAVQRISELMSAGASLIISDYGLGRETSQYTDFIVVTH